MLTMSSPWPVDARSPLVKIIWKTLQLARKAGRRVEGVAQEPCLSAGPVSLRCMSATLGDAEGPNQRQLNRADLSATLNQRRGIGLMLTALPIRAHADEHTNTHTNTQRRGTRVKPNSNISVFPSGTLAGGKKKNQKDCRLDKRDFRRGEGRTRKTNGRNQAEARREIGKIRNFIHLYLAITRTL